MFVEILISLLVLLLYFIVRDRKPPNMPPGPPEIPFLGNVPVLRGVDAEKLRKKYGDIVTTRTGSLRTVLLFDYKTSKNVLNKAEFSGRPDFFRALTLDDQKTGGLVVSEGPQWSHERRFVLRSLHNLGMGKTYLEDAMNFEAKELVEDLKKYNGEPITIPNSFVTCVLNIVWQMVAGRRYDINSEEISKLHSASKTLQESFSPLSFLPIFVPSLKKLPKFFRNVIFNEHILDEFIKYRSELANETVRSHEDRFDSDHPKDLVDEYLKGIQEGEGDENCLYRKGSLLQVIADLFQAGADTVTNSLKWLVFLLARYPYIAQQLQQQIDSVVPRGKMVSLEDKPKLPLVEAFTVEVLRYSSLVEINLPHSAMQDSTIAGYFIPKGTAIAMSNYSIHFNPEYWPDPHAFKPERFLDMDGKYVPPRNGFVAFGLGKRQCVAESLARLEFFVFSAALIQNFDITAPAGVTLTDETVNKIGDRTPLDWTLCYKSRN